MDLCTLHALADFEPGPFACCKACGVATMNSEILSARSQRVHLDCQYGIRAQQPSTVCFFGPSFQNGSLNGASGVLVNRSRRHKDLQLRPMVVKICGPCGVREEGSLQGQSRTGPQASVFPLDAY